MCNSGKERDKERVTHRATSLSTALLGDGSKVGKGYDTLVMKDLGLMLKVLSFQPPCWNTTPTALWKRDQISHYCHLKPSPRRCLLIMILTCDIWITFQYFWTKWKPEKLIVCIRSCLVFTLVQMWRSNFRMFTSALIPHFVSSDFII